MKDLERYLNEVVDPTIKDFDNNPTSVRHAFIACVATFHAIDYLAYPNKARGIRQKFKKASREFALVDVVAHAFKHVVSGNPRDRALKADEVVSRPPAKWEKAKWGLTRWGNAVGGVTLNSDPSIDLLAVVHKTTEFLRTQIEMAK